MARIRKWGWAAGVAGLAALCAAANAQHLYASARPFASNIIMPQSRVPSRPDAGAVCVTDVTADIVILEQAATTTLEIGLQNPGRARQEA